MTLPSNHRATIHHGESILPARKGDWMQTFSGRMFWPLDPRPDEFDLEDIAHALSNICRFSGHTLDFYSVAQHSVFVAKLCIEKANDQAGLYGLLHDASEAYLGDVIRPLKYQPCMTEYLEVEKTLDKALYKWAKLDWPWRTTHDVVKWADNTALATEGRDIMSPSPSPWGFPGGILPYGHPVADAIVPLSPRDAKEQFLRMADGLGLVAATR